MLHLTYYDFVNHRYKAYKDSHRYNLYKDKIRYKVYKNKIDTPIKYIKIESQIYSTKNRIVDMVYIKQAYRSKVYKDKIIDIKYIKIKSQIYSTKDIVRACLHIDHV